jgi:hypothetical protein
MENIFRLVAERRIQEAIDDGKFDNLPGKGKPINLEEDMSSPPHLRVANRILKNAGVLPDWMQLDADIDRERESLKKAWTRLGKEYPRRKSRAFSTAAMGTADPLRRKVEFARWLSRERAEYLRAVRQVNTDITKLLLIAPSVPRAHLPFKIAEETARFDEAFPSPPGIDAPPPAIPARDDAVKETVRSLYAARRRGGSGG